MHTARNKHRFLIGKYRLFTQKLTRPVRVALITDLHDSEYGEDQAALKNALTLVHPHLILLGGDMLDHQVKARGAQTLLPWLGSTYPCYYVTGNHEYWSGDIRAVKEYVGRWGIKVLDGWGELIFPNGAPLWIGGVDDLDHNRAARLFPSSPTWAEELDSCIRASQEHEDAYRILLSHRPELTAAYEKTGFDLIACGHAHGGQVRLPGLLNGLYAPGQGLFPRWAGGRYRLSPKTTMIVSRGLSLKHPLRLGNPPELVVLDILPAEEIFSLRAT